MNAPPVPRPARTAVYVPQGAPAAWCPPGSGLVASPAPEAAGVMVVDSQPPVIPGSWADLVHMAAARHARRAVRGAVRRSVPAARLRRVGWFVHRDGHVVVEDVDALADWLGRFVRPGDLRADSNLGYRQRRELVALLRGGDPALAASALLRAARLGIDLSA